MNHSPPKLASWILKRVCRAELLEEIEGDLVEYYQRSSGFRADLGYWRQILMILRPQLIRGLRLSTRSTWVLMRFEFLFILRNMRRNPFFTLLNIVGISVGLTSCLFVALYVIDELRYDKHWDGKEDIYRVYVDLEFDRIPEKYANATAPMADIFENDFDDVLVATRWIESPNLTFKHGNSLFLEDKVIYADQDIFDVFSLQAIHGSVEGALTKANTLVLTRSASEKYFGEHNPVGKVMTTNDGLAFKITCVIEDVPRLSHFGASMMRSTFNDQWSDPSKVSVLEYWTSSVYRTYLKLRPGTNPKQLEEKFDKILPKYFDPLTREFSGQSWEEFMTDGNKYNYRLQRLTDVHLRSDFQNDGLTQGNIRYISILSLVGILTLLMAYANFINLTTARAAHRHKEIGIKKVIGSTRFQLAKQFILESILISFVAMLMTVALVYVLFPIFLHITGKQISDPIFNEHQLWSLLLGLTLISGLIAGYYPALVLSRIPPTTALIDNRVSRSGKWNVRESLVVFQYSIVVFLLFGTLVMVQQLHYLQTEDLGYSRSNLLVINSVEDANDQLEELQHALEQLPEISSVSTPVHVPGDLYFFGGMMFESTKNTRDSRFICKRLWVDSALIPTLDLKFIEGRNFRDESKQDSMSVILTRSAVVSLGLGDEPIGKYVGFTDGKDESFEVIGVIQDFHVRSLKSPLFPVALHLASEPSRMVIRYQTQDLLAFVNKVQATWDSVLDDHVMSFQFGTDRYDRFYEKEEQMGSVLDVFVVIALFIASLGLIGLATLQTVRRRKEMGIRRVMGASLKNLMWLFGWSLTKPIVVALLIGLPISWIVMNQWLSGFAFHIEIDWLILPISTCITLLMAWMVVILLTYKTVDSNPALNLRRE